MGCLTFPFLFIFHDPFPKEKPTIEIFQSANKLQARLVWEIGGVRAKIWKYKLLKV